MTNVGIPLLLLLTGHPLAQSNPYVMHTEETRMAFGGFVIFLPVLLIGLVIWLAVSRGVRRWPLVVGLILGCMLLSGLIGMYALKTGVRRSISSETHPSAFSYRMDAPDGVSINGSGLSLRDGSSSILVDGSGVSRTDRGQSIRVSDDGVVMQQNGFESTGSALKAAGERAAREAELAAEKAREAAERAAAAALEAQPAPAPAPARTPSAVRPPLRPAPPAPTAAPAAAAGSDEWIDAGQADFEADVYPSERAAAVAGARQIAKSWDRVLPAGQEPTQVLVRGDSELEPGVVAAVIQTLRAKLGESRVEIDKSSQEKAAQQYDLLADPYYGRNQGNAATSSAPARLEADATVRLTVTGDFSYARGGRGVSPSVKKGGNITLTLIDPAGKRPHAHTTTFVNKPWVEHGIDRASQQPGQELVVSRSNRLCPTQSEAEQQAMADAASKLIPLVRSALDRLESQSSNEPTPGIITVPLRQIRSDHELDGVIRAEMLRGNGVKDQFTQRLRKPYGDVWQHAVLIDASDRQITSYAQTFLPQIVQEHRAARQWRASWMRTAVALGLLIALIAVVYAFLNAATRGYYTWMLRGTMVLLVLAGAVLLLLIA